MDEDTLNRDIKTVRRASKRLSKIDPDDYKKL